MTGNSDSASPTSSPEPSRRIALLLSGLLIATAWMIYHPEHARPLYYLDFAEFIPLLDAGTGFADRTRLLVEYYGGEGRFNLVPYAMLAVKWDLFGWWSPGWQIARALLMIIVFALAYVLLRRLGASRTGGLAGASVFLWAPAASEGWVRMTMAEPMGIAIALVMTIRATRFHDNPRWRRECAILGAGTVTLILTKELLAPLILLPVVVALTMRPDGTFSTPSRSARNIALFLTVLVAAAATMAPVVIIYLSADSSSYASLYGREMQSPVALLAIWLSGLVPFDLVGAPGNAGWLIAFVGATILLAAGWRIGFDFDRRARWLLLIALAVPLAGVLAYTPNPWFARFYLLPYLTGAAILTGMAVTYLQARGRSAAILAVTCWVGMSVYAISTAALLAARTDAVQRRDDRLVAFVHDSHDADTVVIAMARPFPADLVAETSVTGAPRGLGANLRRFSQTSDRPWPPTREASCDDGRSTIARSRGVVVLNLEESCDLGTDRTAHRIVYRYRRFDWSALRLVHDSTQARAFRIPAAPPN